MLGDLTDLRLVVLEGNLVLSFKAMAFEGFDTEISLSALNYRTASFASPAPVLTGMAEACLTGIGAENAEAAEPAPPAEDDAGRLPDICSRHGLDGFTPGGEHSQVGSGRAWCHLTAAEAGADLVDQRRDLYSARCAGGVESTNSRVERSLRHARTKMKISGCFQTPAIAKRWAAVQTYIATSTTGPRRHPHSPPGPLRYGVQCVRLFDDIVGPNGYCGNRVPTERAAPHADTPRSTSTGCDRCSDRCCGAALRDRRRAVGCAGAARGGRSL